MEKKQIPHSRPFKENSVIYQAKNGAIELRGDFSRETIWATQAQIAELFEVERSVVTKHIGNILKDKEIDQKSNVQKMHIANSDKPVAFYSLDMILGVGYRTNSARAISFRRWTTDVLRRHIIEGYTINRSRIGANYEQFLKAVDEIKHFFPDAGLSDALDVVELVRLFASTWLSLEAYDKSDLPSSGVTRRRVSFTARELTAALVDLKSELVKKEEASEFFGAERFKDSISGIVGNIFQSFGGSDVYSTIEEKAAHLLYFVVKNHPFTDGNKRSGAFSFVWFLRSANLLDSARLTPEALTALTLLVAESNPKEKDRIVGLILLLLRG
jgi:prophage maintenance system killer protein